MPEREAPCRYLHRGKLRCRRWMIGTLIPQTRELLQHVRKLSQLAGADDASARARSRRARRSLKVPPSSCDTVCCRACSSAVHTSSLQQSAASKLVARAMLAELCLWLLAWVHHAGLLKFPLAGSRKVSFPMRVPPVSTMQ